MQISKILIGQDFKEPSQIEIKCWKIDFFPFQKTKYILYCTIFAKDKLKMLTKIAPNLHNTLVEIAQQNFTQIFTVFPFFLFLH